MGGDGDGDGDDDSDSDGDGDGSACGGNGDPLFDFAVIFIFLNNTIQDLNFRCTRLCLSRP